MDVYVGIPAAAAGGGSGAEFWKISAHWFRPSGNGRCPPHGGPGLAPITIGCAQTQNMNRGLATGQTESVGKRSKREGEARDGGARMELVEPMGVAGFVADCRGLSPFRLRVCASREREKRDQGGE